MSRKVSKKELVEMIEKEFGPVLATGDLKIKMMPWHKAKPAADVDWLKNVKMSDLYKKEK